MAASALAFEFHPQKVTVHCELHGEQDGCLLPPNCLMCIKCMEDMVKDSDDLLTENPV